MRPIIAWARHFATNHYKRRWSLSTLALVAICHGVAAQTFSDGSFETPVLTAGTFQSPTSNPGNVGISPWTMGGTTGARGISTNTSAYYSQTNTNVGPAPAGAQTAFIQGQGYVQESISFPSSGTFTIKFRVVERWENQNTTTGLQVRPLVDGVAQGAWLQPVRTAWTQFSVSFSVSAGSHTINLTTQNPTGDDNTVFLDDLQLVTSCSGGTFSNAGFESPTIAAGQYLTSGSLGGNAWTFSSTTGVSGISSNGSAYTHLNEPAPGGTQVAFIQGIGTFHQDVTFPLTGSYKITFRAAQRPENQAYQDLSVKVGNSSVGQFQPVGSSYPTFVTSTFTIGTACAVKTISFNGLDTVGTGTPSFADNTIFVDSVAIIPSSQSPATDLVYLMPDNVTTLSATPNNRIFGYVMGPAPSETSIPALNFLNPRHIGTYVNGYNSPSTDVLNEAVNSVTYQIGQYTGFDPDTCPSPPSNCPRATWQRGYRDDPTGAMGAGGPSSGFQLRSTRSGMFINTQYYVFGPSNGPCTGNSWVCGGPQASFGAFITGTPIKAANSPWANGGSYEVEAFVSVPYALWGNSGGFDGVAQLSFVLHLCDTSWGDQCPRDANGGLSPHTLNLVVLLADTRPANNVDVSPLINPPYIQIGTDGSQPFALTGLPTTGSPYVTRQSMSCPTQARGANGIFAFTNCVFKIRITSANLTQVITAVNSPNLHSGVTSYVPSLADVQLEIPVELPDGSAMRAWARAGATVNNFSTRQIH